MCSQKAHLRPGVPKQQQLRRVVAKQQLRRAKQQQQLRRVVAKQHLRHVKVVKM
jgi:hypothetical protein